jgi:hypothetical protein
MGPTQSCGLSSTYLSGIRAKKKLGRHRSKKEIGPTLAQDKGWAAIVPTKCWANAGPTILVGSEAFM